MSCLLFALTPFEGHLIKARFNTLSSLPQKKLFLWICLLLLLSFLALFWFGGWDQYLTLEVVGENYASLSFFIERHFLSASILYIILYALGVVLSLPIGFLFTVSGGLLFGWKIGAPLAILSATLGASLIFEIAKTSFGEIFIEKIEPWLDKLRAGFNENALSYLLFLRLVPVFPFFVINLAAAFLKIPLKTFVLGTFLGILPATFAFSYAGFGLRSVLEAQNAVHASCLARQKTDIGVLCPYRIDTAHLITNELMISFILLGCVALLPIVLKRYKAG